MAQEREHRRTGESSRSSARRQARRMNNAEHAAPGTPSDRASIGSNGSAAPVSTSSGQVSLSPSAIPAEFVFGRPQHAWNASDQNTSDDPSGGTPSVQTLSQSFLDTEVSRSTGIGISAQPAAVAFTDSISSTDRGQSGSLGSRTQLRHTVHIPQAASFWPEETTDWRTQAPHQDPSSTSDLHFGSSSPLPPYTTLYQTSLYGDPDGVSTSNAAAVGRTGRARAGTAIGISPGGGALGLRLDSFSPLGLDSASAISRAHRSVSFSAADLSQTTTIASSLGLTPLLPSRKDQQSRGPEASTSVESDSTDARAPQTPVNSTFGLPPVGLHPASSTTAHDVHHSCSTGRGHLPTNSSTYSSAVAEPSVPSLHYQSWDSTYAPVVFDATSDQLHAARHRARSEALLSREIARTLAEQMRLGDQNTRLGSDSAGDLLAKGKSPSCASSPREPRSQVPLHAIQADTRNDLEAAQTPKLRSTDCLLPAKHHLDQFAMHDEDHMTPHQRSASASGMVYSSSSDPIQPPTSPTPASYHPERLRIYSAGGVNLNDSESGFDTPLDAMSFSRNRASTVSVIGSRRPPLRGSASTPSAPTLASVVSEDSISWRHGPEEEAFALPEWSPHPLAEFNGSNADDAASMGIKGKASSIGRTSSMKAQASRGFGGSSTIQESSSSSSPRRGGSEQSLSYGIWNRTQQTMPTDSSLSSNDKLRATTGNSSGTHSGTAGEASLANASSSFLQRPTPDTSLEHGNSSSNGGQSSSSMAKDSSHYDIPMRRAIFNRQKSNTIIGTAGLSKYGYSGNPRGPLSEQPEAQPVGAASGWSAADSLPSRPWASAVSSPNPNTATWASIANARSNASNAPAGSSNEHLREGAVAGAHNERSSGQPSSVISNSTHNRAQSQHGLAVSTISTSSAASDVSRSRSNSGRATLKCELCGVTTALLTLLNPCGHKACASCTSSGLNQVSTSPPRPHICAACGTHVDGISLASRDRSTSSASQASWPSTALSFTESVSTFSNPSPDGHTVRSQEVAHNAFGAAYAAQFNVQNIENLARELNLASKANETRGSNDLELHEARTEHYDKETLSVIRVDNIPWTLKHADILEWIPDDLAILPPDDLVAQPVHIPIDVSNGKTSNACFIECRTKKAAMRLIRNRNNSRLCGRPVSLIHSNYHELLSEVFPQRVAASQSRSGPAVRYLTGKQLDCLNNLMKGGSLQLKDPSKPIEYMASILSLVPADLSTEQAALLFESSKGESSSIAFCFGR